MVRRIPQLASVAVLTGLLAAAWAAVRPSAADLHAQIERILAQPQYQQPDLTLMQKLMEAIGRWLRDLIGAWGPGVYRLQQAWPVLYWVVVGLLVAVLCLLLYHIFATIRYALQGCRPKRRPVQTRRVSSPEDLRERATRLAGQGRFAEALKMMHQALVQFLDRQEILRFDSSRTNWEYVDCVRSRPSLAAHMRDLALQLDRVWYGNAALGRAEYDECADLVSSAWTLVEGSE